MVPAQARPINGVDPALVPPQIVLTPSETEFDEVHQVCRRCGRRKRTFDMFCGQCSLPLIRRFRILLSAEVVLFLAAGVLLALSGKGLIPPAFRHAPTAFLVQVSILYLLRLALRQRRFIILIVAYAGFAGAGVFGIPLPDLFVSVAPLYLCIGVAVYWVATFGSRGRWPAMQTLWVGLLATGYSLSVFLRAEGILQEHIRIPQSSFIAGLLSHYVPYLGFAGLLTTIAIYAGARVAENGVSVEQDYYPQARIALPDFAPSAHASALAISLAFISHIIRTAIFSTYNALVDALNTATRCILFATRVLQAFISAFVREAFRSVWEISLFALLCVIRVVLPLLAIYLAAHVTVRATSVIDGHLINSSIGSSFAIAWDTAILAGFTAITAMCFAKVPPREYAETFVKDLFVLIGGYGLLLFLSCSVTLWLISLGVVQLFGVNLGFSPGYLSAACAVVLTAAGAFVGRRHLIVFAERLRSRSSLESEEGH